MASPQPAAYQVMSQVRREQITAGDYTDRLPSEAEIGLSKRPGPSNPWLVLGGRWPGVLILRRTSGS